MWIHVNGYVVTSQSFAVTAGISAQSTSVCCPPPPGSLSGRAANRFWSRQGKQTVRSNTPFRAEMRANKSRPRAVGEFRPKRQNGMCATQATQAGTAGPPLMTKTEGRPGSWAYPKSGARRSVRVKHRRTSLNFKLAKQSWLLRYKAQVSKMIDFFSETTQFILKNIPLWQQVKDWKTYCHSSNSKKPVPVSNKLRVYI